MSWKATLGFGIKIYGDEGGIDLFEGCVPENYDGGVAEFIYDKIGEHQLDKSLSLEYGSNWDIPEYYILFLPSVRNAEWGGEKISIEKNIEFAAKADLFSFLNRMGIKLDLDKELGWWLIPFYG